MLSGMVASVLSIGLAIVLGMQRGGGTLSSLLLIAAARLNYCTLAYSRNLRLDRFLFVSCADCRGRTTIQRASERGREGEPARVCQRPIPFTCRITWSDADGERVSDRLDHYLTD